jgi:hypothetical protein
MNIQEIAIRARAAGASGVDYQNFISSDDVMEAAAALDEIGGLDTAPIEAAYREGRREHRAANGWVFGWTTAPEDYDQFGTETAEMYVWGAKTLRRVLAHPHHSAYQFGRYGSGGHPTWDEDPRAVEARIREQIARENAEREEVEARRTGGLVWIRDVADDVLCGDEDVVDAMLHDRGLTWKDLRAERTRRREEARAREVEAEWSRCRAVFADGATLVDPGADARRTEYGLLPARDANVWRGVRVEPHYRDKHDVSLATVFDEDRRGIGSLENVVARIERGDVRIAAPGDRLPTTPVLERLAGSRLDEIVRVEAGGRFAWAGMPRFSYDLLVLDERGRKVMKREVVAAAEIAWRERRR